MIVTGDVKAERISPERGIEQTGTPQDTTSFANSGAELSLGTGEAQENDVGVNGSANDTLVHGMNTLLIIFSHRRLIPH